MLVGQAIAESASIFALVVAMFLLFSEFPCRIPCDGRGIACRWTVDGFRRYRGRRRVRIARRRGLHRHCPPTAAMQGRLTTNMLIGSAVCQTPGDLCPGGLVYPFVFEFFGQNR